ncbi:MAG TPA: ABC transporter substrate-binding protein [Clostridia bacterium]|nr:ABC transporter substrate-binding protein [Clostridia bacterium]
MKKFLAIAIAVIMTASLAACTGNEATTTQNTTQASTSSYEAIDISIAALKGPTGMGLAKLIDDSEKGDTENNYTFTIEGDPTQVVALISNGEIDMAACPLNLASTLYQKTQGEVQMVAVNTLGVLYIIENGNAINSMADLKGKTIYATGLGATPEYILDNLLKANSLEPGVDVTVEYLSEHSELLTKVVLGDVDICMLPEPNVTTALSKNKDLRIALDLTDEWNNSYNQTQSKLAQGCIIVNKLFAQENPQAVDKFLEEYEASVNFVNKNIDQAAQLIAKQEIIPSAEIAKKAIPTCNIVCITGGQMKTIAQQNLKVLFEANVKSVGGALPDEDFYYGG